MQSRLVSSVKSAAARIRSLYRRPKAWRAPDGLFKDRANVADVFDTIYRKSIWGGGSGGGSTSDFARPYVSYVQTFLNENGIKSVVDLGCGDWRFSKLLSWDGINYLGVDVVESVIEANNRQYGAPNIRFLRVNVLERPESLPDADLFIVKDVLQHLSNVNVAAILAIAKRYKYALIANDFGDENIDCDNGDTRPLDLKKPPFNCSGAEPVLRFRGKVVYLLRNR